MLRMIDWDQCNRWTNTGYIVERMDSVSEVHGRYVGGVVRYCPICDNRLVQGRCMDCGGVEVDFYGEDISG